MLNDGHKKQLENIISKLRAMETSLQVDTAYLETRKTGKDLVIAGNAEGMIALAMQLLNLAHTDLVGKHYHYDAASMLDHCEQPFVVSYRLAEWDSEG